VKKRFLKGKRGGLEQFLPFYALGGGCPRVKENGKEEKSICAQWGDGKGQATGRVGTGSTQGGAFHNAWKKGVRSAGRFEGFYRGGNQQGKTECGGGAKAFFTGEGQDAQGVSVNFRGEGGANQAGGEKLDHKVSGTWKSGLRKRKKDRNEKGIVPAGGEGARADKRFRGQLLNADRERGGREVQKKKSSLLQQRGKGPKMNNLNDSKD